MFMTAEVSGEHIVTGVPPPTANLVSNVTRLAPLQAVMFLVMDAPTTDAGEPHGHALVYAQVPVAHCWAVLAENVMASVLSSRV